MILEGVVTNVTNFGAFVDIGVHQDGLVHISELADRFVKDPHEVVKSGDVVKVRVMEIDLKRRRIGLSRKLQKSAGEAGGRGGQRESRPRGGGNRQPKPAEAAPMGAMAEAFARLKKG
ncbi:S1 RNA-binding domain-containing protein [Alkalilimnicola ehrlichii]|uniref:S1 RNA-binding domain-containing protein n=1 Tax=Alkalilimnicola ehrlichii TaxID=351052 RepID=UPI00268679A6